MAGKEKSLRGLTEELLNIRLDKSKTLTLTDWSRRQLSIAELQYAALDAWAGRARICRHDRMERHAPSPRRPRHSKGRRSALGRPSG